jgi:hypothetical protein
MWSQSSGSGRRTPSQNRNGPTEHASDSQATSNPPHGPASHGASTSHHASTSQPSPPSQHGPNAQRAPASQAAPNFLHCPTHLDTVVLQRAASPEPASAAQHQHNEQQLRQQQQQQKQKSEADWERRCGDFFRILNTMPPTPIEIGLFRQLRGQDKRRFDAMTMDVINKTKIELNQGQARINQGEPPNPGKAMTKSLWDQYVQFQNKKIAFLEKQRRELAMARSLANANKRREEAGR